MVWGEGIEDRVKFKMMKGEVRGVTRETRIKWRGDEEMERRMNANADLITRQDSGEVSPSFAVNDGGKGGRANRHEGGLF